MAATPPRAAHDHRITAFGLFVEANRRLLRTFDRTLRDRHDISLVWFEALLRLGKSEEGRMSMSQLAEQMVLTSGGITRLVDRLDAAGLVERVACPSDRRVQWAQLTPSGSATLEAAAASHLHDLDNHFMSEMNEGELHTLTTVLERLRRDCP